MVDRPTGPILLAVGILAWRNQPSWIHPTPGLPSAIITTTHGTWLRPTLPVATAGLILLAVGATFERRLTQATQATRWVSSLK
ncbi:hypothetical protein EV653_1286 [Kribbella pratensis]|uniref:Uncharacterized protein n=1 Tax=Kribbella pratensis TaxID=2512112 RepID=A0A4R8CJZ6_9ACTN|nr:hypothetical protein EV653_1286 [Kribbella pratensis]